MRKNKRSPVLFVKKPTFVATQVALALMAQLAYGQQQVAERVERVEITGTRLPALNVEGPSPVTVMDAQEIRMDGLAKTEDLLNNLPQVYAAQGSNASNGASGTANVNLRNLGPTRNLVLINGRRLPAGSPRSGSASAAADLNQIPAPLIQRVELLTGGASAVYGSDAMSGVVNFIMNDRFEGIQFDLYHSFDNHNQHRDDIASIISTRGQTNPAQFQVPGNVTGSEPISGISMLLGKNFADNKGNATLFFNYKTESAVLQRDRDFSACALNAGDIAFTCGGSSTSFPGRFILPDGTSRTVADSAGNTRAFRSALDQFNFAPYNYYRRPSDQTAFSAFAHLDIHPQVRAYSEFGFHDNHTLAQIAPSGLFFSPENVFFENPFLSADWRTRMAAANAAAGAGPFAAPGNTAAMVIARRNIEGGGRIDDLRHTSYRGVVGFKGEIIKAWNYDVYAQSGKVVYQDSVNNYFSNARIDKAVDAITDPATGLPACRSFVNGTDPLCRPYNPWALGGVTADALNYMQVPGVQNGYTTQDIVGATLSSELPNLKLPTARDSVALLFGVERRKERLKLTPDVEFTSADLAGGGGATLPVDGSLVANEWFAEARVPLAQRMPFADLLSMNVSYRHSDYSTNKKTDTYGVGAEWAPVRNYRLRGSYQHAVRHANIQELFQPQGNNLFGMTVDPCGPSASGGPPAASLAQCALTGITPAQYGGPLINSPAGQYNFVQGGNPNLNPETANTYTVGLVLTPVRNLTATVDWWNIKIDDLIGNAPPSTLLNLCLTQGQFCNLIHRDAFGTLWLLNNGAVTATNQNLGGVTTSGLDIATNYTWRMGGAGGFGVHFLGSYLEKWEFEPIKGQGKIDCAGFFGQTCQNSLGGAPNPRWRHKIRGTWSTPWNIDVALTWRHINEVKHESQNSSTLTNDPTFPRTDQVLGARDYLDIAAMWNINKTFSLRAGVNNVFDRDPPLISTGTADPSIFGNGNTFPQTYDALGRVVFMNLTMKF